VRRGVLTWPRTETGTLNTEGDTFRMMAHVPGISGIHALKDSLRVIANARLPIGQDKRNRPSLFPFGAATGRNRHSKSLFNAHAGMRSFMVFPPDKIGAYIDWRTQEIGLAADLSGDPALIDAYLGGDIYHALARMCRLTNDDDAVRWKKQNPAVRQQMKTIQLGINYGMGVASLARGINRHPLIGAEIIDRYRRAYPRFWEWRTAMVQTAMLERRIESVFGWTLRISTSPNPRALLNFRMQAGGADMLRLAAGRLCDAGLVPSMLIHDAVLLETDSPEQVEHAKEIMRGAGRDTCNGLDIGVDTDQLLQGGARFRDKRPDAGKMWNTIMGVLVEVGAVPRGEDAA
jgi:hypothetical protein